MMDTYVKSFHIYDIIYNASTQELTFEFDINGSHSQRISLGVRTDEDAAKSFKQILQRYYAMKSE